MMCLTFGYLVLFSILWIVFTMIADVPYTVSWLGSVALLGWWIVGFFVKECETRHWDTGLSRPADSTSAAPPVAA